MTPLLELRSLAVSLPVGREMRPVLRDVSLSIEPGEAHGLVGESGSGKSMTSRAVMRLLPNGAEVTGEVLFDGASVLDQPRHAAEPGPDPRDRAAGRRARRRP
jgi:ABC-type glutathione transport system ATPase component